MFAKAVTHNSQEHYAGTLGSGLLDRRASLCVRKQSEKP